MSSTAENCAAAVLCLCTRMRAFVRGVGGGWGVGREVFTSIHSKFRQHVVLGIELSFNVGNFTIKENKLNLMSVLR